MGGTINIMLMFFAQQFMRVKAKCPVTKQPKSTSNASNTIMNYALIALLPIATIQM
jgi:hypothetical protein